MNRFTDTNHPKRKEYESLVDLCIFVFAFSCTKLS